MAEKKYDLLLVNTLTDKKIQDQPWFKERLRTKYLKSRKPGDISKTLLSGTWTFAQDGLDDFRDGLPPRLDGPAVFKGTKAIEPNIRGDSELKFAERTAVNKGRFTKEELAFSKVTPLQQQRRDHIDEMEYGLLQHPLALYTHLEESIPPDVFEDVVDILDPEMNLGSEIDEDDEFRGDLSDSYHGTDHKADQDRPSSKSSSNSSQDQKMRNPYRWLPRKEEQQREDRRAKQKRSESPSQDEHIKEITKEFCDWVSSLGGDSNNVEESTIHSLFASGYETKPALSVPIHVVELTNVPAELRMSATVSQEETPSQTLEQVEKKQRQLYGTDYTPSWVKMNYGAWYLNPKTWSRRPAEEPLEDPQSLKDKEMSESKKKSLAMDEQLAPLHGAHSFKEFIEKKGTRIPEFLERVTEFQAQAEAEAAAAKQLERGKAGSAGSSSARTSVAAK